MGALHRHCIGISMIKELKQLIADYMYHRRANKALETLRLHTDNELKDIGLTRGELYRVAHDKCPFCQRFEISIGDGKGL